MFGAKTIIEEHNIPDVHTIEFEPHEDHRGFFMRVYDDGTFEDAGLHRDWVQENHSYTKSEGTVRGLHFQFPPHGETKLVRVVRGEILDVFVDLREDSSTFGEGGSVRLSADHKQMVYIPRGFAHGFCTLTDDVEMIYKMDNYYKPELQRIIHWESPELDIKWPVKEPILSDKDANAESFDEFVSEGGGIQI